MTYRNTKTGMVVETTCEVQGANWVEVKPQKSATASESTEEAKSTKAKAAESKSGKSKAKSK